MSSKKTPLELALSRRAFCVSLGAGFFALKGTHVFANNPHIPFHLIDYTADENLHIVDGYNAQTLIRWGDKIGSNAPDWNPHKQTAKAQSQQFGYNNDFCAFFPLPKGSENSDHGILCINHEYPTSGLMHPDKPNRKIEMEAVGCSVFEVEKTDGEWVVGTNYNRRITARSTLMEVTGDAAGHPRLQTNADPTGTNVIGTLNNCAGGKTPWGTYLTCEENIDDFFAGKNENDTRNNKRMGIGSSSQHKWETVDDRFDLSIEPNEPNRFGWVVEIDPYAPNSMPKKRTSLGRFKHEGATCVLAPDNHVVVYLGDDERFEYLYKFITHDVYDPANPNPDLLDEGTLYVAQFSEEKLRWIPLQYGAAPLNETNGFASQADVVIEARTAAELMGATPMDRPEDVQTNPHTGKVYVALTNNIKRVMTNDANPRSINLNGHILELSPPSKNGKPDHAALTYNWEIFLLAGDGNAAELSCPDNVAFDKAGNLWITSDGNYKTTGRADGIFACATEGENKAKVKRFLKSPVGSEVCGPEFTPDGKTLFCCIQHPGEGSSFANPSTRWPDFDENTPPRPSVVAITKKDGGLIGS